LDAHAKVVVKSTGQVGYFVKESRAGELLIRVPRTDGWPFPDYITVSIKLKGESAIEKPDEVHEAFNFVELVKHLDFDEQRQAWCETFAAYIEAKLKEKNT
jgi:hypothetical protein